MKKTIEEKIWDGDIHGKIAKHETGTYIVKTWGLDSNGCLKTGDGNWKETFVDETEYQ